MFKLRHFTILCTKWAHFKFDACYRSQNSWDRGMIHEAMYSLTCCRNSPEGLRSSWESQGQTYSHICCPETMVQHLFFFSKQFEDVWASKLWVSGVLVEFSSILAWYRFPASEEFVVVFDIFSFNDAPNVLYRWNIWTVDRPIQHPDSSTTKPCCCNSCSMWFCIVPLTYTSSGGEHMLL